MQILLQAPDCPLGDTNMFQELLHDRQWIYPSIKPVYMKAGLCSFWCLY